jgi:hypothetical protein
MGRVIGAEQPAGEAVDAPTSSYTPQTAAAFELPPVVRNARGEVRRAGFEFEFAGVGLKASAIIVQHVFGGRTAVESTYMRQVRDTRFGDFSVEIDSSLLKERRYERTLHDLGLDAERLDRASLEHSLVRVFSRLVPFEIGTPPIPLTELAPLEELRRLLRQNGARGTRASLLYAFGLHINPEIPAEDLGVLLNYLRAFLLLYPELKRRAEVDLARRISPYINPFPPAYAGLVLSEHYPSRDAGRLIDDYLEYNPTRNRPLDLLPLLACLDKDRVLARLAEKDLRLVKPRPAFHYRLPNCQVDEPGWTVAGEWNRWVEVERLANDPERIGRLARETGLSR